MPPGQKTRNPSATPRDVAAATRAEVLSPLSVADVPLIVGIGASAGGLEAYKTFFEHFEPNGPIAFVLVQHLAPDHASMLVDLLARHTSMPVHQATDGTAVQPGHVYVIPPDATLTIHESLLQLSTPAPPRQYRWPIDSFFASLAEDQGENAVGIVLSGSGSDGARGLRAIKERGGLALAQASSGHIAMSGMPASAAATGVVDDVIPVESMPARLVAHFEHLKRTRATKGPDGTRQDLAAHLQTICAMLRDDVGHDFSQYKEKTMVRRIQRRMQVVQTDSVEGYIDFLQQNPRELDNLFRELLIGVTEFFRDTEAFEALQEQAIPLLLAERTAADALRVWIPACATGEEAYSIAIALSEAISRRRGGPKVQIFATDIDDRAIHAARAGRFRGPLPGVSPERLERWFVQDGEYYVATKAIRETIVFSPHSAIKDPPFSRLDLISCRNLLIYLNAELQEHLVRTFHYALRPGGLLMLGPSESLGRNTAMFSTLDKKHRLYVRRSDGRGALPPTTQHAAPVGSVARNVAMHATATEDVIDRNARRALERHAPAYVVIDANHDILRFFGDTGRYLGPSTGAASLNLFALLHKGLRAPARSALQKAVARQAAVINEGQITGRNGERVPVRLIAEPILEQDEDKDDRRSSLCMLIFKELAPAAPVSPAPTAARSRSTKSETGRAEDLEKELAATREQLHSAIDELETANEEMKSANEEYQSVNEELQSSNEELETSKEEMQSINEELQTVNVELNSKNEALGRLNSDLHNLLESTQIATLFLDSAMHVSGFTPAISDLFHLRAGDLGRPLTEITARIPYPELAADVKQVLRTLAMIERVLPGGIEGAVYLLRMRPYRTTDNVIDGVVLTFIDITERQQLDYERGRLAAIVDSSQDAIIGHDLGGVITSWNAGAERMFGYPPARAIGRSIAMLMPGDGQQELQTLLSTCKGNVKPLSEELMMTWLGQGGNEVPVSLRCSPVLDGAGTVVGASTIVRDITERKVAARRLEESQRRLEDMVDQATVGVAQFDLDGQIAEVNPYFADIVGRDAEQLRGKHVGMFTHPDDVSESKRLLERLMEEGTPFQLEERFVRPDGSWVWVSMHVSLIHGEDGKPVRAVSVVLDITQRKLAAEHREILLSELNHRVKNTLSTVHALAVQTLSGAPDLDAFRDAFLARLQSMSSTHDLLTKHGWRGAELGVLVRESLASYATPGHDAVDIDGASQQLTARESLALSMVLHELASNAAKSGALSTPEGRIRVQWKVLDRSEARWLELTWVETGVASVGERGSAFGSRLVTEGIQHELGGKITLHFTPDGLSCVIEFPLRDDPVR